MKIGNPLDLFRSGAPAGSAVSTDAEKAKSTTAPLSSAKALDSATVKLSGGLDQLKADLNADDAFDAKRVEQLKAAIADGSFKVNADVVANKLIASNLEALSRAPR